MGAKYAVSRQVPILLGEGNVEEAEAISGLVLTWMLIVSVIVAAVFGIFYTTGLEFKGVLTLQNGVLLIALIVVGRVNTFLSSYARAHGVFDGVGAKYFIHSVIAPWLQVCAVLLWGVTGALLGMFMVALLTGGAYAYYIVKRWS